MKRALLTGATGFIGRHAVPALVSRGFEVHAVTSRPRRQEAGNPIWHEASLFDEADTHRLVRSVRPTHLLHLAWAVEPGVFWTSPENLRWVGASLNLLRAFGEAGGRRAVIAGTCAEYAWGPERLSEIDSPVAPATLYGAAKDALHRVAARYSLQEDIALAWGRVFFVYGPFEPPNRLVSSVARALLRGQVARCGSGTPMRDYLHVADAGTAFAALLESPVSGPVNIGSGEAVPLRRLIELIGAAAGRPDLIEWGSLPDRPADPTSICADIRHLRGDVGWSPAVGLAEGVNATVHWWRQHLEGCTHAHG